jgi:hypothetical protein
MPTNVRRFVWLWLGSFVLALIAIPFLPPPNPSVLDLGITRAAEMRLAADVSAIIFAIFLPFFWLAVWRRKNWARWVLLVAFVAANGVFLIPAPRSVADPNWLHMPPLLILFTSLSTLTEASAFYFLFTGDAQAWFSREPKPSHRWD